MSLLRIASTRAALALLALAAAAPSAAAPVKPAAPARPTAPPSKTAPAKPTLPAKPARTTPQTVLVKDASFALTLPPGWDLSRSGPSRNQTGWVLNAGSSDRKLRIRVRAQKVKGADKAQLKRALDDWEKRVLNFEVVRYRRLQELPMDVAGNAGLAAIYQGEMLRKSKSVKLYRISTNVLLTKEGWLYIVTGYVQEKYFAARAKELYGVLGSFDAVGSAAPRVDAAAKPVAIAPYKAKMKRVFDAAGRWEMEIPERYTVDAFRTLEDKTRKGQKRYRARMSSPGKNVRVLISSRPHDEKTFDFAGRFGRYAKSLLARKRFDTLTEVVGAGGKVDHEHLDVQWKSFEGMATRKTTPHKYRVLVLLAHSKATRWAYTLTVSLEAADYLKNAGLIQQLMDSFAPYDAALDAEATVKAKTPPVAGSKP